MAAARLKDVAERAGVSVKTVSNVVRGEARVADATRRRVLEAIAELDYRPNTSARRLRTGRSGMIALAVPHLTVGYFAELATAVLAEAKAAGLTVMIEQTNGDPEEEFRIASGAGDPLIDGVILSPLNLDQSRLVRRERRVPLVLLGERDYDLSADHVLIDNVAAAREATAHMAALGRRRIAAIGVEQPVSATGRQRLHGFQLALHEAGLPFDPRLAPVVGEWRRADGAAAMRALLTLPQPPDAVFCFSDLLAMGAMRAVYEHGVRIPDDVALAGFDDTEEARYATPSLTSVSPDKRGLARLAVDALLTRITEPTEHPQVVLHARHTLQVRESTCRDTNHVERVSE
ncbi:LacI family DNA-binding transcriptional regulator [Streptomyces misionensis]|uniref:LacI family DNA-binding transcriptional regulator n=1 Tax=Streptomyces misionensis TaxID=67331 RepID=UPI0033F7242A